MRNENSTNLWQINYNNLEIMYYKKDFNEKK